MNMFKRENEKIMRRMRREAPQHEQLMHSIGPLRVITTEQQQKVEDKEIKDSSSTKPMSPLSKSQGKVPPLIPLLNLQNLNKNEKEKASGRQSPAA